jgi:RNA polymerase sigma factor (sigma-70 family)
MTAVVSNDAELVAGSLAGNREAFAQIVARYQSLICSLAYSATGDLGRSEDLAQETFLAAWKQLGGLNEPAKLRAWLCGIARNLTNNALRRRGREPTHAAELLEAAGEAPAPEALPSDQAISREEAELLWNSLERIPEIYREPIILFYRKQCSVEAVAAALDLSAEAVRQRLSRGRRLLQEQLAAVVEHTLARSAPGAAFTLQVMAAVPILAASTGLSTGLSAAKGGVVMKATWIGAGGAALAPLAGFLTSFLGYRIGMEGARSDEERRFIRGFTMRLWACLVAGLGIPVALAALGRTMPADNSQWRLGLIVASAICFLSVFGLFARWTRRQQERLSQGRDEVGTGAFSPVSDTSYEYRSSWTLLGLPLVHFRFYRPLSARVGPARAWLAFGNRAYGLVLAFGSVAVAPLSFGALSVGLFAFGGCATGLYAFGGLALGYWALGGIAIGWHAAGALALGWEAAYGKLAVAHDYALGPSAHAAHANDAEARAFSRADYRLLTREKLYGKWIGMGWFIPMSILGWELRRLRRQRATNRVPR